MVHVYINSFEVSMGHLMSFKSPFFLFTFIYALRIFFRVGCFVYKPFTRTDVYVLKIYKRFN